MKEDMFRYLPSEIVIDILSMLPISTIMSCKCVCKTWRSFVESPEFAKSHHVVSQKLFIMSPYKMIEFIDGRYPQLPASCSKICFEFPIHSSVDGLCFLCSDGDTPLYICNPITREYIQLPSPREKPSNSVFFGFGVNEKTGRYKLVRIAPPKCEVYTLGAGSWRSIKAESSIQSYEPNNTRGVFLNGNLHWLAFETTGSKTLEVSCFDLATERFRAFSLPSVSPAPYDLVSLTAAFDDELCVCFDLPAGDTCIWLMKEYGVEQSWTMTLIMKTPSPENLSPIKVVKVFKDGETFLHIENGNGVTFIANNCCPDLLLSSRKPNTRTIYLHTDARTRPVSYTPSFLRVLKPLKLENVRSFLKMVMPNCSATPPRPKVFV